MPVSLTLFLSIASACTDDDSSAAPSADSTSGATPQGSEESTAGSESSTGEAPPSPYDGEPLAVVPDGTWQWFDVEGMGCADGRPSGVGVRAVENSTRLAVYFKGGGACFNQSTCALTAPLMLTGFEAIEANPLGVLNFDAPDNPLADFNVVYIPYCTGDVHAGSMPQGMVEGVGEPWDFVGHDNVLAALDRLGPTFPGMEQLLVVGTSAGGMGAMLNFPSIVAGWPEAETFLLNDSGMIFRDSYLAPCLQEQMRSTWSLASALPDDCPACETEEGGGMAEYFVYLSEQFPAAHLGLVASSRDQIVRIFFGYGLDSCQPPPGLPDLGEDVLSEAVADLRANILDGRFVTYVVDSDLHTWIATPEFYEIESGGTPLQAWFGEFLAGTAADIGP